MRASFVGSFASCEPLEPRGIDVLDPDDREIGIGIRRDDLGLRERLDERLLVGADVALDEHALAAIDDVIRGRDVDVGVGPSMRKPAPVAARRGDANHRVLHLHAVAAAGDDERKRCSERNATARDHHPCLPRQCRHPHARGEWNLLDRRDRGRRRDLRARLANLERERLDLARELQRWRHEAGRHRLDDRCLVDHHRRDRIERSGRREILERVRRIAARLHGLDDRCCFVDRGGDGHEPAWLGAARHAPWRLEEAHVAIVGRGHVVGLADAAQRDAIR